MPWEDPPVQCREPAESLLQDEENQKQTKDQPNDDGSCVFPWPTSACKGQDYCEGDDETSPEKASDPVDLGKFGFDGYTWVLLDRRQEEQVDGSTDAGNDEVDVE